MSTKKKSKILTKEIIEKNIKNGKKLESCKEYELEEKNLDDKNKNKYIVPKEIRKSIINPYTKNKYNENNYDLLIRKMLCPPDEDGLPSGSKKKELFEHFDKYNTIILDGATGSGKTVLMPVFALDYFINKRNENPRDKRYENPKVVVTVPKRMAAVNKFPALLMGVNVGEEFGWSTGGNKKTSNKTMLSVVTEGTLLQQVIQDPKLTKYNCVIIDEVHERNIDTDMLLYFVSKAVYMRDDLKLIVMSADAEFDRMRKYFRRLGLSISDNNLKILGVTKDTIPIAKNAPNKINPLTNEPYTDWDPYFLVDDSKAGKLLKIDELLDIICNHIVKIINKEPLPHDDFFKKHKDTIKTHDILVFLSAGTELDKGCEKMKKLLGDKVVINPKNGNHNAKYGCFVLKGGMTSFEQEIITKTKNEDLNIERKIIFSTNVAEASVTIDSLAFVIDAAQAQVSNYDKNRDMKTLNKRYISKAQIKQRIGRVGRTQEGATYFAYPKKDYLDITKVPDYKIPQIHTDDLSSRCLQIINMETVRTFDNLQYIIGELLDEPNPKTMSNSLDKLIYYGCIDNNGEITYIGRLMTSFNKTPLNINRSLAYSFSYGVHHGMIAIMLIIGETGIRNVSDLLTLGMNKKLPEKLKKEYIGENDFISMINIFFKYYYYRIKIYNEQNEIDTKLQEIKEDLIEQRLKAINTIQIDKNIELVESKISNREQKLKLLLKKFCDANYLDYEKLETAFDKLIELNNPIKNGFSNLIGNDIMLKSIIRKLKINDRIKFKLPKYKTAWLSLPIKNMNENDKLNLKNLNITKNYKENLLQCLLTGGFINIAVLDEKTYKYYNIGTKDIVQVSNPNMPDNYKGINYELPKDKSQYPKYIFYAGSTLMGMNISLNFVYPFNEPLLFFIPGLIYYLKKENEDNFVNHTDLIIDLRNKVSSFSHEIKLNNKGYKFSI